VGLDASAVLALLNQEPGSAHVARHIAAGAAISAVNLAEVIGKLADAGAPEPVIQASLDALGLDVIAYGSALAHQTGMLRPLTRQAGLSLGDRACLAHAEHLGLPAVTSERAWTGLIGGITVLVIR
jgi:PIN domain nuclease of toxin-antitoxin system